MYHKSLYNTKRPKNFVKQWKLQPEVHATESMTISSRWNYPRLGKFKYIRSENIIQLEYFNRRLQTLRHTRFLTPTRHTLSSINR